MATARALDVLLGAGDAPLRDAAPPAAIVGAHTLAVTALSRREVTGGGPLLPAATLAATGAVALAAAWPRRLDRTDAWHAPPVTGETAAAPEPCGSRRPQSTWPPDPPRTGRPGPRSSSPPSSGPGSPGLRGLAGAGLAAGYLATFGRAQAAAVADPGAEPIRRAVGAGILGLMPLQASLIARRGPLAAAVAVAAGFPLARRLSRKVSPT